MKLVTVAIIEDYPFTTVADSNNIAYTYNANGTRLTAADGKSMTYDNEGQTTTKGTETYTFNVRHQFRYRYGIQLPVHL